MPLAPTRLALCLAAVLLLPACGDADDAAPTTGELEERAADMETPTDAAAPPLDLASAPDDSATGETDALGAEAVPPAAPPPPVAPPRPVLDPDPVAPPAPSPAPQPDTSGTTDSAEAAALWTAFRRAVAARDGSAIETLIANPVRLNGQMVPHAEFAEMTPGGSVSDFITSFEGELSTTDALSPAAGGGYQALATARTEDTESALVFRIAPDTDGTWRIVAIDLAG